MPFVYSKGALSTIRTAISRDRLSTYMAETKGNIANAVLLYERNTRLSQSLYGVLQPLEISFKNSVHRTLTAAAGSADWFKSFPLRTREIESVENAKKNIVRWSYTPKAARIVAELAFGFWTQLVSKEYEKTLWVPHLYKAFPHLDKPDRHHVFVRLMSIKTLRNRIAHHKHLLSRNLPKDYSDIIETLEWICPTTAAWVQATNRFHLEYSN